MAMTTMTDILNLWADYGVFAYLLPFLLIFAFIFGILSKTKVLGENKGVNATIALAAGLLSLQFDYVANFFAVIWPFAGIGLAVLLVAIILMSLFITDESWHIWVFFVVGAIIFIVVLFASIEQLDYIVGYGSIDSGTIIGVVFAAIVIGLIIWAIFSGGSSSGKKKKKKSGG